MRLRREVVDLRDFDRGALWARWRDDLAWFLAMHTVMVLLPTLQAANIVVVTTQQQVSVPIGD